MDMARFLGAVAPVILECEGTVTSWIRSRDRNAKVGGHPNSYHLCGLAVDVVIEDQDLKDRFKTRMRRFGFGVLDGGSYVHVQAIPAGRSK